METGFNLCPSMCDMLKQGEKSHREELCVKPNCELIWWSHRAASEIAIPRLHAFIGLKLPSFMVCRALPISNSGVSDLCVEWCKVLRDHRLPCDFDTSE